MSNLYVLVATNHLDSLGGTETYTYSIIEELKRRRVKVEYFTFRRGLVSEKIENNLGIKFMSRKNYDLILANHNTCVDALYLKGFTVQTCHGIYHPLERPSHKADYHVSISKEVQNHLYQLGFRSKIIYNGINCERFSPKKFPKANRSTVLSLCQSSHANDILQGICYKNNLNFKSINKFKVGIWNIEDEINQADLVIGLGRSAYEAMACGKPVVIYDNRDYSGPLADGYLTIDKIELSIQNNCSGRKFGLKLKLDDLENEILKCNFQDGLDLRNFAENNLNIQDKMGEYFSIYSKIGKTKLRMKFFFKIVIKIKNALFEKVSYFSKI